MRIVKTGSTVRIDFMVFDTDQVTPKTGLADGSFAKKLSKDGVYVATPTVTVSEVDSVNFPGLYEATVAPDVDYKTWCARISNATYMPRGELAKFYTTPAGADALDATLSSRVGNMATTIAVTDATPTSSSFIVGLTGANSFWADTLLVFRTGALAGQVRRVLTWTSSSLTITTDPFTAAPATGDKFDLIPADSRIDAATSSRAATADSRFAHLDADVTSRAAASDWSTARAQKLDALVPATSAINDAFATTTQFNTNLTNPDGTWNGATLEFRSGVLAGEARPILDFLNANGRITLAEPLSQAPANADSFAILPSVSADALANLDAPISSRLATTDPAVGRIDVATSTRAATADSRFAHLDVDMSSRAAPGAAMTLASASITDTTVTALAGNKLADHTLRRGLAAARASSNGDAIPATKPRNLLAAVGAVVNKHDIAAGQLRLFDETDAGTPVATFNLATTPSSTPVTSATPA